jgi:hypothetical protein
MLCRPGGNGGPVCGALGLEAELLIVSPEGLDSGKSIVSFSCFNSSGGPESPASDQAAQALPIVGSLPMSANDSSIKVGHHYLPAEV